MKLPYPHARNDCGACREHDADVQVLGGEYEQAGERPLLLCQGYLGRYAVLQAIQQGGPKLDQPFTISLTVALGRKTNAS